jgi:flagellar hook-length control protein FliK
MTALAFGTALINGDPAAAGAQPLLPQVPLPQLPDLPVPLQPKPLQFGEQLRQSLDVATLDAAAALPPFPVTTPGQGHVVEESSTEPSETLSEDRADEATPSLSTLVTLSQPVVTPLEYAQRSADATQPQASVSPAIVTVSQWATPDATAHGNAVLSALQATTSAAMPLVAKDAPAVISGDKQSNSAMAQLASLTNGGAVQAMVEGMTRQPGMLAPAAVPAQTVNLQRSPLEAALGERLQLHITQRSEHAVIRLDPPSMGTIEIVIQREAGSIQVHLRASNAEVARQLHGIGDALRQDLIHRQHGDVSVHVSDGSREQGASQHGQRQQQAQREAPGRALSESDEGSPKSFTLAADEERAA